jgi:hypothetical protein
MGHQHVGDAVVSRTGELLDGQRFSDRARLDVRR